MSQPAAPPPIPRDYYALIPHPLAAQVLLIAQSDGWALPHLQTEDYDLLAGAPFCRHLQAQLGLSLTQLRVAAIHVYSLPSGQWRWLWALIALENHSPGWTPPAGARWVDRTALADLTLAQPEHREFILTWLTELETGVLPALRSPWARPGWWAAIHQWVTAELAVRGRHLIGPLEQRKTWGVSCLLRGETAEGPVWVKGAPALPLFANEAAVTAALAAAYPAIVPTPLAIDADQHWLLLDDFDAALLKDADFAAWETLIDRYAALQVAAVNNEDRLLALGCLDRRLPRLVAQIPFLLTVVQTLPDFSAAEQATLVAAAPQLVALCAELAACGVPATLVHGDLHDHNIAVRAGQPLIFDWSDACIAHPFLDLTTLLFTDYLDAHPDERAALRDRYLVHWAAYGSPAQLQRTADLAAQVGALHQAISYAGIVSNMEPTARWESSSGLTLFVRQLLQLLATPLPT